LPVCRAPPGSWQRIRQISFAPAGCRSRQASAFPGRRNSWSQIRNGKSPSRNASLVTTPVRAIATLSSHHSGCDRVKPQRNSDVDVARRALCYPHIRAAGPQQTGIRSAECVPSYRLPNADSPRCRFQSATQAGIRPILVSKLLTRSEGAVLWKEFIDFCGHRCSPYSRIQRQ